MVTDFQAWGNLPRELPRSSGGCFGYQEDPGSGLKLLGHRYYDSSTGRFLTRDPAKDGRNWYGYCGNATVTWIDPEGLKKCVWVSGDRGGVVFFEKFFLIGVISSGWTWLEHPTDLQVLSELVDADVAVFWGHGYGKGGAHLYNSDYTGGNPDRAAFDREDLEVLRRIRRGKKLQTLYFLNCNSVQYPTTVESMLAVAHVVVGYEGSTIQSGPTILREPPQGKGTGAEPSPVPQQIGGRPHPRVGRVHYD